MTVAAAGALTLAAVAASNSAEPQEKSGENPEAIRLSGVKMQEGISFNIPSVPDSMAKSTNPFSGEKILDNFSPVVEKDLVNTLADWTTILPDTAGNYKLDMPASKNSLTVNRFITGIRPDTYFSGKLKISTPGAAKVYINGKEILSKSSFDSVPNPKDGSFSLEPAMDARIEVDVVSNDEAANPTLSIEIIPDEDSKDVNLIRGIDTKTLFNIYTNSVGPRVANADLSPDGKYMLILTSNTSNGIDYDYYYTIEETASGKLIAENVTSGCSWLPGVDHTLYFNKKSVDGTFSIMTLDVPSMKISTLASGLPSSASDYTMSPSGDFIITFPQVKGTPESGTMARLKSPDDRQPGQRDRYYLTMIDLKSKIARPLTYGGNSTYLLDISRDGKKMLYYSLQETPDEFPFYKPSLVNMDLATLASDTVANIDSSFTEASYSPDGKKLLILAGPNAFNSIGLNAGNFDWGNDFDIQIYLADIDGNNPKAMTREFDPAVMNGAFWNPADRKIYFRGEAGFDVFLYRLDPESGKIDKLPSEVDYIRSWSISEMNPVEIAYTGMSYNYMGRAYLLDAKSGKSRLIADPMKEELARMEIGNSEMVYFTAKDGTEIEGTLTYPPNFDPSKKYPMIVYYYGGTTPCTHTNTSPYTPNLFASRGYVVYTINPSGTIGYGQEFSARHVNAWGERTADEIIQGTQEMCKRYPFIKKDKIGCIGASYGGFMTQLLQTKTDIFAAAVSHAGISNITSYWGEGYWGYSYNAVAAARSYPWNNPKLFTENSPLFHADKIHTPLLLLHGTVDTNVPIGESIQLYNALKILGREVEFITVDNQNHIIMDFQKRKEWHATIMAWFEKWLKDDPRWWNSIYK